jgi:hypothetical protein
MWLSLIAATRLIAAPSELRVGVAGHAFDHLGGIGEQAEAAVDSGANIIYATGLGGLGYQGLPAAEKFEEEKRRAAAYHRRAKAGGIRLVMGYLCATSIVKLEEFDRNWTQELRAQFRTRPSEWRQQDRNGKPLASWYGGDYQPACMKHPDWRAYERFMVREQLEAGCDGIFFDNPTVHPQGCYCEHCMKGFAEFLASAEARPKSVSGWREFAAAHPKEFMRFRCTIARDFLREMRESARKVNRRALVTCNNSFNSPDVLFSQCRSYAYNIYELSKAEDFVVVEDMGTQPWVLATGKTLEYGPSYRQLHAISHGKPIVAVTITENDYHTPPNLVRLAMAEAAANNASYLSWPTWPENVRQRMCGAIRPQADFLRRNEKLLNDTRARRDVIVFLPFRRWVETEKCTVSGLAAALTKANVQYEVVCEDELGRELRGKCKVLVVESHSVLKGDETVAVEKFERVGGRVIAADEKSDWLGEAQRAVDKPSIVVRGPPTLRAMMRDQPDRTIIHLLNLNVERLSSFEDKVHPASEVRVICRVPFTRVSAVRALTADEHATQGALQFTMQREGRGTLIETTLGKVEIATMLIVER